MSFFSELGAQTLHALQQQLVAEMLETGFGGFSLADALLKPRMKSGREISAQALTGRIRSDAGMLRQASSNVSEAGAIAEIIRGGAGSIADSLQRMQEIANTVASGETLTSAMSAEYNSLAKAIEGTVASTSYNGIYLMDKTQWRNDERVSADDAISIQAGTGSRPLTLQDFSGLSADITANTDLSSAAGAASTAAYLSEQLKAAQMQEASYKSLASSFTSEAESIDRQADILAVTAARAEKGAAEDPFSRLLYRILSDQGKLFDESL